MKKSSSDDENLDEDDDSRSSARPVWTGTVSFGIVAIGVKMFSAVREHTIHFHQISKKKRKRIRYLKVIEGSTVKVAPEDIVKGFQVEDGSYVTFDNEELERIAAQKSKIIEIEAFVGLAEIDPLHFNNPYYLVPSEAVAEKPYHLLAKALAKTNRVGIAHLVMHGKEYLVAVRNIADTLCLETLHFSDEIIDPNQLRHQRSVAAAAPRELKMAEQLIDALSVPFKPTAYKDSYQDRLHSAIERKAKGNTVFLDEPESQAETGKVLDLMEALRISVEKSQSKGKSKSPASRVPKRKTG